MKKITTNEFDEVIKSNDKMIIEFGAEWCGPCKMMSTIFDDLEKEGIKVYTVDVDEESELTTRFGIRNIPTIFYYENGQLITKSVGASTKSMILDKFSIKNIIKD